MALFLSCNRANSNETLVINGDFIEKSAIKEQTQYFPENQIAENDILVIERQFLGFPDNNPDFILENIGNEFIGVFLPVEYIVTLKNTRNHSLSMHNNNWRYHDVLAVFDNSIFSNLRFRDRYAIRASEGNLFQFRIEDGETKIIDSNGYSYIKISNDPVRYHEAVEAFVAEIILGEVSRKNIGVSLLNRTVTFPFLYPYINEDTFFIRLTDAFFERGINLLFTSVIDWNNTIGLIIEENNFHFYSFTRLDGDGDTIFCEITNSKNWIMNRMENRIYSLQVNKITE